MRVHACFFFLLLQKEDSKFFAFKQREHMRKRTKEIFLGLL